MTIQEMKERKRELGYTNARLAELSGVPLSTVQKVLSGATAAPRRSTLLALERVLVGNTARPAAGSVSASSSAAARSFADHSPIQYPPAGSLVAPSKICDPNGSSLAYTDDAEESAPYRPVFERQGSYTLDDYYALPDDLRVELIDGVFFVMDAPTTIHQAISGYIHMKFLSYVLANNGICMPFISPVDVQLDQDDKTILEPDVVVVCNRDIIIRRCIYGAPDLVIEVLSPSTRRKDMIIKLNKYLNAGVREYWIIDPDKESVTIFDFMHDDFPVHYSFDDTVPVRIWDGKCSIDFKEVRAYIGFIYQNEEKR